MDDRHVAVIFGDGCFDFAVHGGPADTRKKRRVRRRRQVGGVRNRHRVRGLQQRQRVFGAADVLHKPGRFGRPQARSEGVEHALVGFGLGGVLVTTTTLMMEEWPKKSRAIFVGILSISIPIGIFSAGVIDYFVSSWRQGFLVGIAPVAIAIVSLWFLKESEKWKYDREELLTNREKKDSAFSGQHTKDLVLGSLIFGTMLIGMWAIFSWLPTWIQSLITTGDAQKERGISMMMLGMGGLTGGFLSGWLTNAIGPRRSMLLCFSVCILLSFLLFKTNSVFSNIIYAEIVILALFFGARSASADSIPTIDQLVFYCYGIDVTFEPVHLYVANTNPAQNDKYLIYALNRQTNDADRFEVSGTLEADGFDLVGGGVRLNIEKLPNGVLHGYFTRDSRDEEVTCEPAVIINPVGGVTN